MRGRAEDHRPERGAVKITGLQGWHSRSERQNRCNTDQRPEVGAIRIMSAGTGAIRIMRADWIVCASPAPQNGSPQNRAAKPVAPRITCAGPGAHARFVARALAGKWRRAGLRMLSVRYLVRSDFGSAMAEVSRSEVSCARGSGIEFTAYAYRTNGKRQGVNTLCHRVIQGQRVQYS